MKIDYMKDGKGLCTEIDADYKTRTVKIKNHTNSIMDRAFGVVEHPTFDDFEYFLEDRCFPRTRDKMKLTLKIYGITSGYNPLVIAKKMNGRVDGDDHYLIFKDEGEFDGN